MPQRLIVLACLALALAPSAARARVTVEKAPVVVTWQTFDRRNPPREMPPLGPRADAVTHFKFGCSANATYEVTSRRRDTSRRRGPGAGGCTATARINDLDVRVELVITVWVPRGARRKLVDHEDGHRIIGERIYETAERAARDAARQWAGRSVTGKGEDCAAAADAAVRDANHQFCQAYLEATSGWSSRVGDLYDEITDHGRRDGPAGEEAIRLAFEREAEAREQQAGPAAPAAETRAAGATHPEPQGQR
jgi:hypothetical protein